ncbi:hypothetical protein [Burkholderia glumae]|uniref:hypothetical protein n=1 Tax=Burkholderia glumae TaxID=337 RepID=UPI0012FDF2F4|nr:hypothetical protein [Burkholderia glumae]QHE10232.1 hypothetical protein GQR88_07300 [Burkholderia glumae AU6208]
MTKKKIFVIMPFVTANSRNESSLTSFFNDYIKHPIETATALASEYVVHRSGNSFTILDTIIEDIAKADVVICDLSGEAANPNVMFELGLRLATSPKPTILIREENSTNKKIFDVSGLYTHPYSLTATRDLERFLIEKLAEYETNHDSYESPVLKILNHRAAFWMMLPVRKASAFLGGIASAADACLDIFSKALELHLASKNCPVRINDSSMVFRTIGELSDPTLLDDFNYNISSIPSLDSYLSSVYLLGLVEDDVEKQFRRYAMAYSLNFNRGNSALFASSRFEEFMGYAYETLMLMNLSRIIINILDRRQGGTERVELVKKFFSTIEKSNLAEFGGQ